MNVVSVDKSGRLIIPAEIRKKLGIDERTKLFLVDIDGKIIIEKLDRAEIARRLQEELKGVDVDQIAREAEGAVDERARHRRDAAIARQ